MTPEINTIRPLVFFVNKKKHIHTPIHDHAFMLTQSRDNSYVDTEVSMIRQTHEHNRVLVSVVSEIRDL